MRERHQMWKKNRAEMRNCLKIQFFQTIQNHVFYRPLSQKRASGRQKQAFRSRHLRKCTPSKCQNQRFARDIHNKIMVPKKPMCPRTAGKQHGKRTLKRETWNAHSSRGLQQSTISLQLSNHLQTMPFAITTPKPTTGAAYWNQLSQPGGPRGAGGYIHACI